MQLKLILFVNAIFASLIGIVFSKDALNHTKEINLKMEFVYQDHIYSKNRAKKELSENADSSLHCKIGDIVILDKKVFNEDLFLGMGKSAKAGVCEMHRYVKYENIASLSSFLNGNPSYKEFTDKFGLAYHSDITKNFHGIWKLTFSENNDLIICNIFIVFSKFQISEVSSAKVISYIGLVGREQIHNKIPEK